MSQQKIEKLAISLANYLHDFIDDRPWDIASCTLDQVPNYGGLRETWLSYQNQKIDNVNGWDHGHPKWGDESKSAEALIYGGEVVEEHFKTTGQRIWGLTFTLHPDGKFNIDYNYNRPEWYTEEDELADASSAKASTNDSEAASLAMRLNSLGVEVELDEIFSQNENIFFSESLAWLREKTAQLERDCGLGSETNWNLDLNTGLLTLSFQDGLAIDFAVQIIGTYNTADSTLMWAWDHPSVPLPLRKAAEMMRQFLVEKNFNKLTKRTMTCSEADAWVLTAAATRMAQAKGAYRGKAGDTWVYMCLFDAVT